MPTDMSGRHHMNPQIARMHDQQKPANLEKPMEGDPETHVIELHKHADGHFSTLDQKDGEQMDHESSDAAHEHMKMKHGDDMDEDFDNDHNEQVDAGRKVKMADSGGY